METPLYFKRLLLLAGCIIMMHTLYAQEKIMVTGTVTDGDTKESLVGASVIIKNSIIGTVTDWNGKFSLELPAGTTKSIIQISYLGFETQEQEVSASSSAISVSLTPKKIFSKEVVVSASRISERILESPVSIEKMDAAAIKETPSLNFYEGLAQLKSVDVVTSSLTYKNISIRGFGNTEKPGILQLIDGVDNQAPGMNYPIGYQIVDLDVENTELIPGAASALYGANAFNGVINITGKNPFKHQGLSVQLKSGINHTDGTDHQPAAICDFQMRYAKALLKDRLAFKVTAAYFKGQDWVASDYSDVDVNTPLSMHGLNNPSYDGLNMYGDEVAAPLPIGPGGSNVYVSRSGYMEKDLVDYNSEIVKLGGSLHYKITSKIEASYDYHYSMITTVLHSANRYALKDFGLEQHKVQINGPNYFVRGYMSTESSGKSYDSRFLAINMNNAWKSNDDWFNEYAGAYLGMIPGVAANDHVTARAFANSGMPQPGTDEFNMLKKQVASSTGFYSGGAKFSDNTKLYHAEGQYDFSQAIKVASLIAGASYRNYKLNSNGTLFPDGGGHTLGFYEYGMYAQLSKKLLNEKLKLTGSGRYDKSENYKGEFSPRISGVLSINETNFIRASYQTAFRMPTSQDQYIDLDLGFVRVLGGLQEISEPYNLSGNVFTQESVMEYGGALGEYINMYGMDSAMAGIEKYKGLLEPTSIQYVKPEKVKTWEAGYRGLFFNNNLYVDLSAYLNRNTNFIGAYNVIRPGYGGGQNSDSVTAAAYALADNQYTAYQVISNLDGEVQSHGFAFGLTYNLPANFVWNGNLTISHLDKAPYGRTLYNTPMYKTNIGISNKNIFRNTGFSVNWRWADKHEWQSLFGDGMINASNTIDAQVSYRFTKLATSLKVGAANALNSRHTEVYGGPTTGGVYYASLVFDGIFK